MDIVYWGTWLIAFLATAAAIRKYFRLDAVERSYDESMQDLRAEYLAENEGLRQMASKRKVECKRLESEVESRDGRISELSVECETHMKTIAELTGEKLKADMQVSRMQTALEAAEYASEQLQQSLARSIERYEQLKDKAGQAVTLLDQQLFEADKLEKAEAQS